MKPIMKMAATRQDVAPSDKRSRDRGSSLVSEVRNLGRRNRRQVSMILVFAVTAYAFWPSLHNGFVKWDDHINFTENLHYRGFRWPQLMWMFTSFHMGVYIPLTWISFAIDYMIWGLNPTGYHLTSLLLHAGNGVLVYQIATKLIQIGLPRESPPLHVVSAGAVVSALLFSVHPLRVESVAWATERRDVLCGFFFFASTLLYLESSFASGGARRRLRVGSLIAYLLSLLSKAASVPLPFLLIVLDFYISKKQQPERNFVSGKTLRRAFADKLPYFALAIPFAAVAPFGQARHSIMASAHSFGVVDRIAVAAYSTVFYLAKTLWPQNLSSLYSLPSPFNPLESHFVFCALLLVLASVAAARFAERVPALPAAWAWYLVALMPTSGIFQAGFQIAADRYTYLPCLSWAVLGGAIYCQAWRRVSKRSRDAARIVSLGATCLITALVVVTRAQTLVWRDTFSLWERVVELEPNSMTGHNNLGAALAEDGRLSEAIPHFRFVLERDPGDASARHNLEVAQDLAKERAAVAPAGAR